ncbi:MAG TPA: hypothetical protein VNV64_04410, partial [Candidatus Binatia bacterium]|nr:hypothetical protein [Candidatus Binatia bacterium]
MKLAGVFAANCFFAFMLFSGASKDFRTLSQEPAQPLAPTEKHPDQPNMETRKVRLAIHGGAGTIERSNMTPERER